MHSNVQISSDSAVGTITFQNPPHNALSQSMLTDLCQFINRMAADPGIKIIVIQSAGKRTFCAGASFDEMASIPNISAATKFFLGFAKVIHAMISAPKPVIVLAQGKAVGGAVGLLAAADYTIATKYASVRLSEISIGLAPLVIEPAISSKIGLGAFQKLANNPVEWQTAKWAQSVGLLHEVFESNEQAQNYLNHYVVQTISYSLPAQAMIKSAYWAVEDLQRLMVERAGLSAQLLLQSETQQRIKQLAS